MRRSGLSARTATRESLFGGNKTRKLEYLVADALAKGCDTLVSIGGVQSNHTRQVAAVAARAGLACVLVQESWVDWPDAVYDKVGNILISRLAGADVRLVRAEFGIGFKESWEQALREIESSGGGRTRSRPAPPTIPSAASASPTGPTSSPSRNASSASSSTPLSCARSPAAPRPGWSPASPRSPAPAAGRGGSSALTRRPSQPRPASRSAASPGRPRALIGVERELADDDVHLDERYHAGVYGIPDAATLDAMRLAARTEGMVTDPVYEGKSMAALIDLVSRREIPSDATVLYAHLGGQPAINAYSALFS